MRQTWKKFLLVLMFFPLIVACMQEDNYSMSTTDQLSFSADTLSFDTIISGEATSTKLFKIYNTTKRDLFISSVSLVNGDGSSFHVNVDGVPISKLVDNSFEIKSKDSVYAFIEVNAEERDEDLPFLCNDDLKFHLSNGVIQQVHLKAYAQTVIPLKNVRLYKDTTFKALRPYRIYDTLRVEPNVTLTIAPGTRLYFHSNAELLVDGRIKALGTLNAPIIFRGDRLDNMFTEQSYDAIPGQWGGITLLKNSIGNIFQYCDIHGGNYGIKCDSTGMEQEKLLLENSIIHNLNGNGLELQSCSVKVGNTQITNALKNCVTINGGAYDFIHCTIANFYSFDALRGHALDFSNYEDNEAQSLDRANFINCILTGYSTDEIFGHQFEDKQIAFNYSFKNCLLNTAEVTDDEHFVDCQWDLAANLVAQEKNFYPRFDLNTLTFTFTLDSLSLAIGNADYTTTQNEYPNDRNGVERTLDGVSDIGCYERIINKEK